MHAPLASGTRTSAEDHHFLSRAIEIGRRGWGRVAPNPMVGCIVVHQGEIVGEGWHDEYGGEHAEVMALRSAGPRAEGATVFVSLEPCRHEGKTPPCTKALLRAGVSRVVYGAADPGEDSGGGGAELAAAGVDVVGPLLTPREAERENPGFFHRRPDRPWVELKLALSLDGRISEGQGVRTLLSGEEVAQEVHLLRAGFDAILVGSRTALTDDPALTVRGKVLPRVPPRRVVADSQGILSDKGRLFREGSAEVWVLTTARSSRDWREAIAQAGGRIFPLAADHRGRVEVGSALALLAQEGVRTLLCEGGGILGSALLEIGAVDRLHLIFSPRFLGGKGVPAFAFSDGNEDPIARHWLPLGQPRVLGQDLWVSLERRES